MNKFYYGVFSIIAFIGVCAIIMWTVNYEAVPSVVSTNPKYDVAPPPDPSGESPLIGRHVKLREGWAIKYPAGTQGVIVAVPGSEDYCGRQGGTSVRWNDFPSKEPSCHWMAELEIE